MAIVKIKSTIKLFALFLLLSACDNCECVIRKHDIDTEVKGVIEDCYFGMNSKDREATYYQVER